MSAALPTPPLCPTCGATTQVPGPQGPAGAAGAAGPAGPVGPQGPAGVGNSMLGGVGAPGAGLGNTGDWYFNTANGDVYQKTAPAVWTFRFNTVGPSGSSSAIQTSTGVPNNGTGADGDWDLDTTAGNGGDWYHKVTGAWVLVYTNTIPLASRVTGTLGHAHGGTDAVTLQAAINGMIPGANGDVVTRIAGNVSTLASPNDATKVLLGTIPLTFGSPPAPPPLTLQSTGSQSMTVNWSFPHGLGSAPRIIFAQMVCNTAELGYSIGDVIFLMGIVPATGGKSYFTISANNSHIFAYFDATASMFINNKTTGASTLFTFASWDLQVLFAA